MISAPTYFRQAQTLRVCAAAGLREYLGPVRWSKSESTNTHGLGFRAVLENSGVERFDLLSSQVQR
jgi:hypothetical protein